ncbi:MAG: hypothetical protein H8E45_06220 [Proteobacteria bacterium]|nr:hypothetical protein [Pseudomonadota bacterium]
MKAVKQPAGFPRAASPGADLLAVGLLLAGLLALPTQSYGHQRLVTGPLAMKPAPSARAPFEPNARDLARLRFLLLRLEQEHDQRTARRLYSRTDDLSIYFDTAPRPTSEGENK